MLTGLSFLKRVSNALQDADIPFMLVGGMALNMYAIPRMTRDFDIVLALDKTHIGAFIQIFEGNSYIYEPAVKEEVERKGMFNVIDLETHFRIDFIILKHDEYSRICFERKQMSDYLGFDLYVSSPEDLIISKLQWIQSYQSEKQMNDISLLLGLEGLDKNYIANWIEKLRLKTFDLL